MLVHANVVAGIWFTPNINDEREGVDISDPTTIDLDHLIEMFHREFREKGHINLVCWLRPISV